MQNKDDLIQIWDSCSTVLHPDLVPLIFKPSGKRGGYVIKDYIKAITIAAELRKWCPAHISHIDSIETMANYLPFPAFHRLFNAPMLCTNITDLKPDAVNVWESEDWIFTENVHGERAWLYIHDGETVLYGRHPNEGTFELIDYALALYIPDLQTVQNEFHGRRHIIDVMIGIDPCAGMDTLASLCSQRFDSRKSYVNYLLNLKSDYLHTIQRQYMSLTGRKLLTMFALTSIHCGNRSLIGLPLSEGVKEAATVIPDCVRCGIPIETVRQISGGKAEKQIFHDAVIEGGSDGIIAYNLKGCYVQNARPRDAWIKIKPKRTSSKAFSTSELADTLWAFVTGYKMESGLVSHLELSIYAADKADTRHQLVIAYLPIQNSRVRESMTVADYFGAKTLDPQYYNNVYEIGGNGISRRNVTVINPYSVAVRTDMLPDSCVYTYDSINMQLV